MTGVVVLAAGGSTRMGRPKQLVEIAGGPLLARMAGVALASALGPVAVVVGGHAELARPVVSALPVRVVENPDWQAGMGGSIRVGVAALTAAEPELDAIVLMVGDQPGLTADWLRELVGARGDHPIAAARYDGVLGVPAVFDRALFPALLSLDPSEGAKRLLRAEGASVVPVPFAAGADDLDTPDDLDRWLGRRS